MQKEVMIKLEGIFLPYIYPSLCKSSHWNSSPSWEANARDITPVSSSVHGCSKLHRSMWLVDAWCRKRGVKQYIEVDYDIIRRIPVFPLEKKVILFVLI
jgi:hypothetical protein